MRRPPRQHVMQLRRSDLRKPAPLLARRCSDLPSSAVNQARHIAISKYLARLVLAEDRP
jgi:hypothetical protein